MSSPATYEWITRHFVGSSYIQLTPNNFSIIVDIMDCIGNRVVVILDLLLHITYIRINGYVK